MGALSALSAYGQQDVYLTGNPTVTFWKVAYRRYCNFALESIEQTIQGSVGFGNKVSATITRNGDLVTDLVLEITLKKSATGLNTFYPAEALLSQVDFDIGGTTIDRHYADWYRVYDALFRRDDQKRAYRRMTDWVDSTDPANSVKRFYVPLLFHFCGTPGLALPIIALNAGQKSIPPRASGPCARENRLSSQGFCQMLVTC